MPASSWHQKPYEYDETIQQENKYKWNPKLDFGIKKQN